MATLGNSFVDLIDVYKQQDGQGNFVPVIEILMEMNPILEDAIAFRSSGAICGPYV